MLVKFKCLGARAQLKGAIDMFQLPKQEVLSNGRHQSVANSENLKCFFQCPGREFPQSSFSILLLNSVMKRVLSPFIALFSSLRMA